LVATEVPDPVPAPGEALIDVELASVTFVETQIRAGKPPHPSMLPRLPAILGNGVGGVWQGRRVITSLSGTGGYAERAVAPVTRASGRRTRRDGAARDDREDAAAMLHAARRKENVVVRRSLMSISTAVVLTWLTLVAPVFAQELTVEIQDAGNFNVWGYTPMAITVTVGDSVTWKNSGTQSHTATADDASWDTDLIGPGDTGYATFDAAGTFAYYCQPHPWMKGSVVAVDAITNPAASTNADSSNSARALPGR
jgi:plastocyanin